MRKVVYVFLLAGSLINIGFGQSQTKGKTSKVPSLSASEPEETLQIGDLIFRLGMPKDAVLASIVSHGYTVSRAGETYFISLQRQSPSIGGVAFRNGKLSWIQRSWSTAKTDDVSAAGSIYAALSSATERNRRYCFVDTNETVNSSGDTRSIQLTCVPGRSYIRIDIVRLEQAQGGNGVDVSEILSEQD